MYQFGSGDGWRVIVVINNVSVCEKKNSSVDQRASILASLFILYRSVKKKGKKRKEQDIQFII